MIESKKQQICYQISRLLARYPDHPDMRVMVQFEKPYLTEKTWFVTATEAIGEEISAVGNMTIQQPITELKPWYEIVELDRNLPDDNQPYASR